MSNRPFPNTIPRVWLVRFAQRIWQRHRWSVPLSLGSAFFFARLAWEVHEKELDAFDVAMQHVVNGWRGSLDTPMLLLTDNGSFGPMALLAVTVFVLLVGAGRPREARFFAVSALGCVLLNVLLKLAFQRARPHAELPYLIVRPSSFSFPSGHTMGSAGVLGSVAIVLRVLRPPRLIWIASGVLCLCLVLGVATSRVYLGAHYPSDVLGGLLAASSWLAAVTGWTYPRLLPHEATIPPPPPLGPGPNEV